MKGITMSAADVKAHQSRHGFKAAEKPAKVPQPAKVPKPRQNKTEQEYGLILEAMKRRGEILDYRPFGIKLEWGADPATGKPMVYSPDFIVFYPPDLPSPFPSVVIVEVKGGYIHPQDWIRFKGCRAEWPNFLFQLYQKTSEGWRRLL
jgi:hypothetical protein